MLSYKQALDFIHGLNRFGIKLGLHNITKLLELLGNPHKDMKIIHVAGTNGKGSTCAMIDSILRSAGFKVGLYTSPYLEVFNERMRINGENISNNDLARLTNKVREKVIYMRENDLGSPTEFDVVTAIGFLYFKEQAVDFLVLEVGMGGRLDATNVVTPLVSVITPISLDHQQYLGSTLKDIAKEKCGILKPNIPVITGPQKPEAMAEIEEQCLSLNCSITKVMNTESKEAISQVITYVLKKQSIDGSKFNLINAIGKCYTDLEVALIGAHQVDNAAVAIGVIEKLASITDIVIPRDAFYKGLREVKWPGRLEVINQEPIVLLDGGHNIAGIKTLKNEVNRFFKHKRKIVVVGILEDKAYRDMIKEIVSFANAIITTTPDSPRALSGDRLSQTVVDIFDKAVLQQHNINATKSNVTSNEIIQVYNEEKIENAIKLAFSLADSEDIIIFCGSLYLIGHVRKLLRNK